MEVVARLEFTTPCLGNVRKPDYDRMSRDRDGKVIFMPSWWRAAFTKAAIALSRYHRLVDKIYPALQIEGRVSRIKRLFGSKMNGVKIHEGFDIGTQVVCRFALPHGMTVGQFTELLEDTGLYIGVSPYGWRDDCGRFRVLSVDSAARRGKLRSEGGESGSSEDVDRSAVEPRRQAKP